MKTIYVACKSRIDPLPILEENQSLLKEFNTIGLVSTIQHLHTLPDVKKRLEASGKKALVGGQVLGCDTQNAAKIAGGVECILYVGSGRFHPLKIACDTGKRVLVLNTETREITPVTDEDAARLTTKRKGRIARASSAETFGILVSTKTRQMKAKEAWNIKDRLEAAGKKAFFFAGEERARITCSHSKWMRG
ncbi:MAG: diphthamide synthesis protein [Candidatus Altiarchaeota archaeon]